MRIKPSDFCLVFFDQREFVDLQQLGQEVLRQELREQILAISLLVGEVVPLSAVELAAIRAVPRGSWSRGSKLCRMFPELGEHGLLGLARKGMLVTDSDDSELSALRTRHDLLQSRGWDRYAALFHVMTRWRDRKGAEGAVPGTAAEEAESLTAAKDILRQFLDKHGPPPEAFHCRPDASDRLNLELPADTSPLTELLSRRRTTRSYDIGQPMSASELSSVLFHVYGCHGVLDPIPGLRVLKKTSPSAGALHSIEAYPLVMNVEGVAPGLYHYRVADHSLELLRPATRKRARALADLAMPGQGYPSQAGVLFLLTARFERQFWKYRNMPVAYTALMVEAGHLSQTFYLVCADQGLGAFVSQAINGCNIDEELGLDGLTEGAIAVSGCGRVAARSSAFDPDFANYTLRSTSRTW